MKIGHFIDHITAFIVVLVPLSSSLSQNYHTPTCSTVSSKRHLFIFGLAGNVGSKIAQECILSSYFDSVVGTVRACNTGTQFGLGIPLEEHNRAEIQGFLSNATHVLVTIPPIPIQADDDKKKMNITYQNIILDNQNDDGKEYSKYIRPGTWVGFVSTTGVYGDHAGGWVNESSDTRALVGSKVKAFLDHEEQWQQRATEGDFDMFIFRCAGLYSSSASALHTVYWNIRKHGQEVGIPSAAEAVTEATVESFTSRIHIDDVARAIISSMNMHMSYIENQGSLPSTNSAQVYNLADDEPAPRSQVMAYARDILASNQDLDEILNYREQSLERNGSSNMRSSERSRRRSRENKKVQNTKMKEDLLPDRKLIFPTYREGLTFILKDSIPFKKPL
mmetsp:Transcript_12666/g.19058  ORF Transcript_12666/g.19058 Transcript_12666/m.19058 type:complete len:391 (+) Transcript_12666:70-1242(+)